ncbi:MAG TPA: DinB family protein [Candidatus Limnocylindria bacterium]|nr:DinB family protein [Candidatus Limnocylindria bacterium]
MSQDQKLRDHVSSLLAGRGAHEDFDAVIEDFPKALRGAKVPGVPYTPWRLLEHLRITQSDLLEYSRDPKHKSPEFPAGYWPDTDAPPSPDGWERSARAFRTDLEAMRRLVADPGRDLLAPLPHAPKHTLLREALILADHNAYHLGQLVVLRRLLGAWPA